MNVVAETLTGASSAWNTILAAWEEGQDAAMPDPRVAVPPAPTLDSGLLSRQLQALARSEGVLGCGVVDLERGDLLLAETRGSMSQAGLAAMARALADARAAHGRAAGPGMPVPEELQVVSAAGIDLLRASSPSSRLGLAVRIDRYVMSMPLVRVKLGEVEKLIR